MKIGQNKFTFREKPFHSLHVAVCCVISRDPLCMYAHSSCPCAREIHLRICHMHNIYMHVWRSRKCFCCLIICSRPIGEFQCTSLPDLVIKNSRTKLNNAEMNLLRFQIFLLGVSPYFRIFIYHTLSYYSAVTWLNSSARGRVQVLGRADVCYSTLFLLF